MSSKLGKNGLLLGGERADEFDPRMGLKKITESDEYLQTRE
jgi:hypothetical protein